MPPHGVRPTLALSVLLGTASVFAAEKTYSREELFVRTPFPVKTGATGPSTGAYELRGFFGTSESMEVSIRRPDTGESRWIAVGSDGKWKVTDADPDAGTATLVTNGVTVFLKLANATDSPRVDPDVMPKSTATHPESVAIDLAKQNDGIRRREVAVAALKAEHPEYFENPNTMNPEQRRIAKNAIDQMNRKLDAPPVFVGENPAEQRDEDRR